jgi:hypothetical protein
LTHANLESQWVHFEAGSIAQKLTEGRVSCLLVGLSQTDVRPPLGLFQNTSSSEDDVFKLVSAINILAGERGLQAYPSRFGASRPRLNARRREQRIVA